MKTAITVALSFACGVLACIIVGAVLPRERPDGRTDLMPASPRPDTRPKDATKKHQARPHRTPSEDELSASSLRWPYGLRGSQIENAFAGHAGLLKRIMSAYDGRSPAKLEQIEGLVKEAEALWDQGYGVFYFEVMFRLCWGLQGRVFHGAEGERHYDLLCKCAELVFAKEPLVPLELQFHILSLVARDPSNLKALNPDAWPRRRTRSAKLVFHTWSRLIECLDPGFDRDNPPMYPDPPGGPHGGAPEAFEDPVVRRQYEKAIAEHLKKHVQWSRQLNLRGELRMFSDLKEGGLPIDLGRPGAPFIVAAYSEEPYNSEELCTSMQQAGLDEETKAKIMAMVAARIKKKATRTTVEDR